MNDRFLTDVPRPSSAVPAEYRPDVPRFESYDEVSDHSSLNLANLLRIVLRWRWLILSILSACFLASAIWAFLQTPMYRATATLELNPAPTRVVQLEDDNEARQSDRDYLALQIGLVKSRNVAEKVARRLNLGRDEAFLGSDIGDGRPEAAVGGLIDGFSAMGTASDRIMQISFVHPDPAVAAKVANGFAEQAVESNFERGFDATARSRAFLSQRLERTRQQLEASERQLIDYARRANIVNIVAGEGSATTEDAAGGTLIASRLVALNQQLAEAQNARIVAQQRFAQASGTAAAATASDSTVQTLQQQRAQLQAEYDQKLDQFFPEHPTLTSLKARIASLEQQIRQASGRTSSSVVSSLRSEMVAAQNREAQLRGQVAGLQSEVMDLGERGVQYTILKRAVEANRTLYNALLARLGEENTSATRTSGVAIVDNAQVPGAPFSPNIPNTLILGLLGGLVLGVGAAFGADRLYDTVNSPEDIRDLLGLSLLGVIPSIPAKEDVEEALADPGSSLSEAYHSVRVSLQFVGGGRPPKSILFTSSKANEGKTSSVIAMAADYNSLGYRVLVIDADLRKPSIKGSEGGGGLAALLGGNRKLNDVILSTETRGLFLIEAGATPPDPTVLLASEAFRDLVAKLEETFDVIIIDGPPVLGLADAPLISSVAKATVMIVQAGETRRGMVVNSLRRLNEAGGQVVGAVLTKFDTKKQGFGYGYGYGYADQYYQYGAGEGTTRRLIGYQGSQPSPDQ